MDSRSQQPMINLSGSGRKRNKENQSDASLAGIRQQGSGNALDLFLQRRAESIKRSRTIGTSSEFDKNNTGFREYTDGRALVHFYKNVPITSRKLEPILQGLPTSKALLKRMEVTQSMRQQIRTPIF
nr:PREDICTED: uncharacterized protein LOC108195793 [Daucus carota subsp. sativus]